MDKKSRITRAALAAIAASAVIAMPSCSYKDENAAEERARQFAQSYFNMRFGQAAGLCTENSVKWIKYHASNISQDDIDVLDSQTDTAVCEIDDIDDSGDSATVSMTVRNFLRCDSIGKRGRMCKEANFQIAMKKVGDKWLVNLAGPLQ